MNNFSTSIIQLLQNLGIKYIFGTPGSTELTLVEATTAYSTIDYLFCAHEMVAVGMADGYARALERPSVVNLHSAQGVLNAAGFIRVCKRDCVPLIILVGTPSTDYSIYEPNHFQYSLMDIINPIVKWTWGVTSCEEGYTAIIRAYSISMSAPKGPVCIFVPQNLLTASSNQKKIIKKQIPISNWPPKVIPDSYSISTSIELMRESKRTLLFVGNGSRSPKNSNLIEKISKKLSAPILFEALDRGPQVQGIYCSGKNPLCLGFFDSRKCRINKILDDADLIIFIGCKATYPRVIGKIPLTKKIIQIDEDIFNANKDHPTTVFLHGDIFLILKAIIEKLTNISDSSKKSSFITDAKKIRDDWSQEEYDVDKNNIKERILPSQLASAFIKNIPKSSIIVDDSQCFSYFLKPFYKRFEAGQLYGSMASHIGWALPASLGIKLAKQQKHVFAVIGDCSLIFSIQALASANRFNIPIIVIVVNNFGFMSLKLERKSTTSTNKKYNEILSLNSSNYDFATLAHSFGMKGYTIDSISKFKECLKKAITASESVLLNVLMSEDSERWAKSWLTKKDS